MRRTLAGLPTGGWVSTFQTYSSLASVCVTTMFLCSAVPRSLILLICGPARQVCALPCGAWRQPSRARLAGVGNGLLLLDVLALVALLEAQDLLCRRRARLRTHAGWALEL